MDSHTMELILGVCLGVGLSAACGFRVFVPMFALSLAGMSGQVELSEGISLAGHRARRHCLRGCHYLRSVGLLYSVGR